ncbi:MAG: type II CAAX prenyl endopeptidase Rce1 family protein, partial [Thermoplasmata archaeon]
MSGLPSSRVSLPAETRALRTILGVVWLLAIILFVVYLGAMLVSLVLVSPGIVQGIVQGTCSACTAFLFWINPLSPTLFQFVEFGGTALLVWFSIVLAVIFSLFGYLFLFHARGTYRDMRLPPERVAQKLASRSPIVAVGQIFMAILFFNTIYIAYILPALGVEPVLPPFFTNAPAWFILFTVVNATVWEELAFRVLLIGVPLVLASLVTRLPQTLSGQPAHGESRSRYLVGSFKYLFGGQVHEGSSRTAILVGAGLVLISAIIFGYLHVPGSGAWRFVNTFISGLAMGYLFLRHGLLASILFHLSVNSLGIMEELAAPNLVSTALFGLLLWALVAFGAGFLAYYAKRVGGFLLRPLIGTRRRPVSAPQPNPRPSNP